LNLEIFLQIVRMYSVTNLILRKLPR